ncbi:MAG: mandelate racemase/muconate lactonizing enzyme family protein [Pseudomonadota bacterium]|nr:mandelate racemase/muconate lactonizing enzyme family protein [Pseudomonadota bacterium]
MPLPDGRISRIEGYELRCAMPAVAGNALRVFSERSALLIRIVTASGHEGWGETWAYPGPAGAMIRSVLGPALLGADVSNPRAAQAKLLQAAVPDRRGQVHMAVSALDIAMWDALGQVTGKPLHALLGGALRDRVRAYASGPLLPADDDRYGGFEEEVTRYAESGFTAVKIRIGISLAQDLRAIGQARSILGDSALLMADLNESSTVRDAVNLAQQAVDANLAWIEEPLPHDDLPGYRRLAQLLPVALAGGESFCGAQAFRDIMREGALDIVQPDLAVCGGITEGLRITGLADAFDVPVSLHVWGTGVNFLAALQFSAILTPGRGQVSAPLFEYDASFNPLRDRIYDPKPDAQGNLAIPDGPGLGMKIPIDRLGDYVQDHWVLEP